MALTDEQIENIRAQLREQIQNLPEDKKAQALQQIESLSSQALESLLKQQSSGPKKESKTVFRMIVDNDIPSAKIDENKFAIAVLDINPISKGHAIIIPKNPVSDSNLLPTTVFTLAKKLAKKLALKLKTKSIEIQTEIKFGEAIINIIPCYGAQLNLGSPRSSSTIEQLEEIASGLRHKQTPKIEKIKIKTSKNSEGPVLKLPRRIP